nr:class I SAM-dependent methyltransferase [uncultured Desulfobacter sp.]
MEVYKSLKFRCLCKKGDLEYGVFSSRKEHGLKRDGLVCSSCGRRFPIINQIPRFVAESNYADSFGFQWNQHARTQLDSFSGLSLSRDRVFSVTGWPNRMKGSRILEAGSGAGRFTEVLLTTGADVYSFDYSSAVEANYANNGGAENLSLFQGDIFNIPFGEQSFEKVFCLGVIQHTPDPERAFKSLAKQVKPGGELVIDAYTKRFVSLLQWKYLLRPISKRMDKKRLYHIISSAVPLLLPLTIALRRVGGRFGAKLSPIVDFSYLDLPYDLHKQWSILDTFDWYAPAHDHPQSVASIQGWYRMVGFVDVKVTYGPNGVIAKGRRPEYGAICVE